MIRICQCGLATDDPDLLEDHLKQYGHRERVPWWDKFTQVLISQQIGSRDPPGPQAAPAR